MHLVPSGDPWLPGELTGKATGMGATHISTSVSSAKLQNNLKTWCILCTLGVIYLARNTKMNAEKWCPAEVSCLRKTPNHTPPTPTSHLQSQYL